MTVLLARWTEKLASGPQAGTSDSPPLARVMGVGRQQQQQLIHALISNRLDYCNSVLYNLPKSSILRLQIIQNQAARILTRTPRRDHITEVLIDLHWLKIKERIVYKILIFTFKAFIDRTAPLYLCELIEQQKSKTNTRLVGDPFLLKPPRPSRNCADTFFLAFLSLWSSI